MISSSGVTQEGYQSQTVWNSAGVPVRSWSLLNEDISTSGEGYDSSNDASILSGSPPVKEPLVGRVDVTQLLQ